MSVGGERKSACLRAIRVERCPRKPFMKNYANRIWSRRAKERYSSEISDRKLT